MNADHSLQPASIPPTLPAISPNVSGDEGGLDLTQVVGAIRRKLLLVAGVTTVVASAS
ncbi:MAG: hypothetical protein F6K04_25520 [Leptolyngbya sp. SIO4C5]|nr:hypothetical protein [Leptolyngbya sp. SIO4C5]